MLKCVSSAFPSTYPSPYGTGGQEEGTVPRPDQKQQRQPIGQEPEHFFEGVCIWMDHFYRRGLVWWYSLSQNLGEMLGETAISPHPGFGGA